MAFPRWRIPHDNSYYSFARCSESSRRLGSSPDAPRGSAANGSTGSSNIRTGCGCCSSSGRSGTAEPQHASRDHNRTANPDHHKGSWTWRNNYASGTGFGHEWGDHADDCVTGAAGNSTEHRTGGSGDDVPATTGGAPQQNGFMANRAPGASNSSNPSSTNQNLIRVRWLRNLRVIPRPPQDHRSRPPEPVRQTWLALREPYRAEARSLNRRRRNPCSNRASRSNTDCATACILPLLEGEKATTQEAATRRNRFWVVASACPWRNDLTPVAAASYNAWRRGPI